MRLNKLFISSLLICLVISISGQESHFENGLPDDPGFFPIAVWLQDPADATAYKAGGINLYIGLWQGPTENQLSALRTAGMPVICSQNSTGLNHLDDSIIVGWTQQDEPDNAQPDGSGGYDPCIDPDIINGIYDDIKSNDPTRPVYLNLGQGVANINYVGRGECTGDTWMYPFYIEGCDIVSFDIYPVTSKYDHIRNNLWYVAEGIDNLREWSEDSKPAWCWIECTHIKSENKPTPSQVKSEIWMGLIHGAKGFGYFCHEWIPEFNSNALLDDPVMFQAVTTINEQIHQLAPVLNSDDIYDVVFAEPSNTGIPVDIMVKTYNDSLYIFAVAMRDEPTEVTFTVVEEIEGDVTVMCEDRNIAISGNNFEDHFDGYDVRLYKIGLRETGTDKVVIKSVNIFPNPCSGHLTLSGDHMIQQCSLINLTGQIILNLKVIDKKIDISNIQPGMYVLRMWINNSAYQKKIVITG